MRGEWYFLDEAVRVNTRRYEAVEMPKYYEILRKNGKFKGKQCKKWKSNSRH
jgi:hypothetical protein